MIIVGITNRNICEDLEKQIKKIAQSNLDYLIIREKDLNSEELLKLSLKIKAELKNTNIKIIINSNIKVAKQIGAHGIQFSFNDFLEFNNGLFTKNREKIKKTVDNFRIDGDNYKVYKMIGVSIHSFIEGIQAYNLGADYLIYGHVFKTDCKKDIPPRGIEEIQELSKKIDIPIIGIGGIDQSNFQTVLDSGAKGIAIMSTLMKAENPKAFIKFIKG